MNTTAEPLVEGSYIDFTFSCIITVLVLVGNITTVVAFWKVPLLREKPSNLLILNLTCADLGVGFSLLMVTPGRFVGHWLWGKTGCQINVFILNFFIISGMLSTLAISVDRFLLITKSYPRYIALQSQKTILTIIAGVWIYALTWGIVEIILWDVVVESLPEDYFDFNKVCESPAKHAFLPAAIFFLINFLVPLIAIEVLSVCFVGKLRDKLKSTNPGDQNTTGTSQSYTISKSVSSGKHLRSRPGTTTEEGETSGQTGRINERRSTRRHYMKAAVTFAGIVILLNSCLLPYIFYVLITSSFCPWCRNERVSSILFQVVRTNSSLNPFMYALTMTKIRQFYKKHLLCIRSDT